MPQQRVICTDGFIERSDVSARNQQRVDGSLRVNVPEGDGMFVFINFLRRDFSGNDAAKQATHGFFS
jgi:hypothetical protein